MRRRTLRNLRAVLLVVLAALAAWKLGGFDSETLAGRARVIDGDTLVVSGARLRLEGIDAPELAQMCRIGNAEWPCGREAAGALRGFLRDGDVVCQVGGTDRYGRGLATCDIDGDDLSDMMVRSGWAVTGWRHVLAEREARGNRRGIWRGTFEHPQDWRRDNGI